MLSSPDIAEMPVVGRSRRRYVTETDGVATDSVRSPRRPPKPSLSEPPGTESATLLRVNSGTYVALTSASSANA